MVELQFWSPSQRFASTLSELWPHLWWPSSLCEDANSQSRWELHISRKVHERCQHNSIIISNTRLGCRRHSSSSSTVCSLCSWSCSWLVVPNAALEDFVQTDSEGLKAGDRLTWDEKISVLSVFWVYNQRLQPLNIEWKDDFSFCVSFVCKWAQEKVSPNSLSLGGCVHTAS